jgi:adenylate kinase
MSGNDLLLPDGWESSEDGSGGVYYTAPDGKSTWDRPPAPGELPEGWIFDIDPKSKNLYYVNKADGTRTWKQPPAPKPAKDADKIPVTIITGFLGAGKTTLLNRILNEKHGMKIAVIENEFGEINIDEKLIKDKVATAEDIVTMDNGCVCCSVRGDLVKALFGLAPAKAGKRFDHIIIETTGLADPKPVAFTFSNPGICDIYRVDAIVTLVDCKHVEQHLHEEKAGLDEGILSFYAPNSRLYGESLYGQQMKVTNDSAPSSIRRPTTL